MDKFQVPPEIVPHYLDSVELQRNDAMRDVALLRAQVLHQNEIIKVLKDTIEMLQKGAESDACPQ